MKPNPATAFVLILSILTPRPGFAANLAPVPASKSPAADPSLPAAVAANEKILTGPGSGLITSIQSKLSGARSTLSKRGVPGAHGSAISNRLASSGRSLGKAGVRKLKPKGSKPKLFMAVTLMTQKPGAMPIARNGAGAGGLALAGMFDCRRQDSSWMDLKTNPKNAKWVDFIFHCDEKNGDKKTLTATVLADDITPDGRESLALTNCLHQFSAFNPKNASGFPATYSLAPGPTERTYFRINFVYHAMVCDAAQSRQVMDLFRGNRFAQKIARPVIPDPKVPTELYAHSVDFASSHKEFPKWYQESYTRSAYANAGEPSQLTSVQLLAATPKAFSRAPGMEWAVQIAKTKGFPASGADPCAGWDKVANLWQTLHVPTGKRHFTSSQWLDPSTRKKLASEFYTLPGVVGNGSSSLDFTKNKLANFPDDGGKSPYQAGSFSLNDDVYYTPITVQLPVMDQPPYDKTHRWACQDKIGLYCSVPGKSGACSKTGEIAVQGDCACTCFDTYAEQVFWARVVPVTRETADQYSCVSAPSNWVQVTLVPYFIDPNANAALAKMKSTISEQEQPEWDEAVAHKEENSPVKVELVSYKSGGIPSNQHNSIYIASTDQDLTLGPYPFGEMMEEYADGASPMFYNGCAYNPDDLKYALHQFGDWQKIIHWDGYWDLLEDLLTGTLDVVNGVYEGYQSAIVIMIATWIEQTGVKCGEECRMGMAMGIKVGLSYMGLPPSVPDAAQLYDQGAEYIAMQAASYMAGGALDAIPELANIPFGSTLFYETAYKLAQLAIPSNPFRKPGMFSCDETLGVCGQTSFGEIPESWGYPSAYGVDTPATLYLRVSPNPTGQAHGDTTVIHVRSKTGIWKDTDVPINLHFLKKPIVVPVVLQANLNYQEPSAQEPGGYVNVALVEGAWWDKKFKQGQVSADLEVSTEYRWTDKNFLYHPEMMKVAWIDFQGKAGVDQDFGLVKHPGVAVYGQVPKPQPCPGFFWDKTGLRFKGAVEK